MNQKLTASTKTESGVEFTVSGVKKDDKLDGDIKVLGVDGHDSPPSFDFINLSWE